MKIQTLKVKALRISETRGLEPISVILEDIAPGKGRVLIECSGDTFYLFPQSMGEKTVAEFIALVSNEYLVEKLMLGWVPCSGRKEYVTRIALAVQAAIVLGESRSETASTITSQAVQRLLADEKGQIPAEGGEENQ